jgi:hypothetical protein
MLEDGAHGLMNIPRIHFYVCIVYLTCSLFVPCKSNVCKTTARKGTDVEVNALG